MITRQNACTIGMLMLSCTLYSQRIGIGTNIPDPSAILDVTSTEKGILLPRLTTTQRLLIGTPDPGLLLFDITTFAYWYYDTMEWKEMKSHWIHNGAHIYNANAGNVGIGLTDPTAPLDVAGTIRSWRPGSSPDGSYISFDSPDGDPGIIFDRGNGSGGQLHRWDLKIADDQSFRIRDHSAGRDCLTIDVNGNIGIGTSSPHASAALEVMSVTGGFLPPRMTQAQRDAIASPVEGLMIWCNDCGEYGETQVYDGSAWNGF